MVAGGGPSRPASARAFRCPPCPRPWRISTATARPACRRTCSRPSAITSAPILTSAPTSRAANSSTPTGPAAAAPPPAPPTTHRNSECGIRFLSEFRIPNSEFRIPQYRIPMILLIDNYDSFTYNLVQRFGEIDPQLPMQVVRNDQITLDAIEAMNPTHIIVSPGPCTPKEAGISNAVLERFSPSRPVFGVCLGHQCIGHSFGGDVIR